MSKKMNSQVINSKTYYIMANHYLDLGKISEARMMINEKSRYYWDASRFNNIINKLCKNGLVYEAENLVMKKLSNKVVKTDFATYQILIEAYIKEAEDDEKKVDRVDDALELFEKMVFQMKLIPRKGFCEKLFDQLINKWGRIDQVANVIERMGAAERDVKPDPTCYEIVITGLMDAGKLDKVEVLLDQMVNNFTIPTFPDSSNDHGQRTIIHD
ncbi:hypothetical protein MKW92_009281 [Papaver armeniacum]|nr:hypothetical protein MKW92_009281 [Papaver armeniacum]